MSRVLNIAAYKFAPLSGLADLRESLRACCKRLGLKGTILLSPEGINLFIAGSEAGIGELLKTVRVIDGLADLEVKESYSDSQPFSRMLVRLKKEIIAFGVEGIEPGRRTSPKIDAATLKIWLDEGRDVTLLDVRNDYEVELGTFKNAKAVGVGHFRDFPEAVAQLPPELRDKPIVMFCTGGIRCEKAGPFMEREGFREVHQLDGGILKYFEECGDAHYDGDCFVFDHRVAVDPRLRETDAELCFACQAALTPADRESPRYVVGVSCPYCFLTDETRMQQTIEARHAHLREITSPLPGSVPRDNPRPMNVPERFSGMSVIDFLDGFHPQVSRETWQERIRDGRVVDRDGAIDSDRIVRGGERFDHILPSDIEPDICVDIEILHEDEAIVVVKKPAPLPMHPSGRFNRNTLLSILNQVYAPQRLRTVHRLDANTTGVVILARTKAFARRIQPQFESGSVDKTYIARVHGHPDQDEFEATIAISERPQSGGLRLPDPNGRAARTRFRVLWRDADGTSLVEAIPLQGRTNQIRLHLWDSGHAIVGDPSYLEERQLGTASAISVDAAPMCLHARSILLRHPLSNLSARFEASCPDWANSSLSDAKPASSPASLGHRERSC